MMVPFNLGEFDGHFKRLDRIGKSLFGRNRQIWGSVVQIGWENFDGKTTQSLLIYMS